MTRTEFIEGLAERTGMSTQQAEKAVEAFLESIKDALLAGDEITFTGFGKFSPAHVGRKRTLDSRIEDLRVGESVFEAKSLSRQATELRKAAKDLEGNQKIFDDRIQRTRRSLREIAETT